MRAGDDSLRAFDAFAEASQRAIGAALWTGLVFGIAIGMVLVLGFLAVAQVFP